MKGAELKMARAYTALIAQQPFFATLLLRLNRFEDTTAKTMWVDGKNLGYNPEYVETLEHDELVGSLCHLVLHIAAMHPWRREGREEGGWNLATDKVVNAIIEDTHLRLPDGAVPGVKDKAAEQVYYPLPPGEDCEGGGGTGDVRDPKGEGGGPLSQADREHQMNETRIAVAQAANVAKQQGRLPAGLNRFVDEILEPKVPWREILARFLDQSAKHDYNWMRPNRKYMGGGIMLPSLHSPAYGQVIMGCDTSGSIDMRQMKEICAEVLGLLEGYTEQGNAPELTVVWFDSRAYPQTVSEAEDMQPKGGGGTDFSVVFKWAKKHADADAKAIIMVTDGYCDSYGTAPEIPVLWILTEKNPSFSPPFGEVAYTLNE